MLLLALAAGAVVLTRSRKPSPTASAGNAARIDAVGPTIISNQTAYPLTIYGAGFAPGDKVAFEGAFRLTLPATFVDPQHLTVRLPPQPLNPLTDSMLARVSVEHADGKRATGMASLTVVNDASFAEPYACTLTPDGSALFVASPTTDEIYRYDTHTGSRETMQVGDGPRALAVTAEGQLVVADELAGALEIYSSVKPGAPKVIPLGEWPEDLVVDGHAAVVTTRQGGLVHVDLQSGKLIREALPGRQPRALALAGEKVFVAQLGTDDVVDAPSMKRIAPGPGVRIVGGRTEKYGPYVMGGKAARALAYDPKHGLVFASTIGPNIGPNPDRVEVSMNGGVEVIDANTDQVLLHRGLGAGVLEGLAVDPSRDVLYAADIALGRVLAFDTGKLRDDPEHAELATLEIAPPENTPHVRPDSDFLTNGRASLSIHSGPRALCLDSKRQRLYVVNRFSGKVSVLDVHERAKLTLAATFDGPEMWNQKERRLGDILFSTDIGRSGMSCDSCHLDGHTSGILYEKTHPLRIYRVTTLRGIRDSAPYFTPSALPSLPVVAHDVLARNRFHNPDPSEPEIAALAEYQALIAVPPNPNVGPNGEPKTQLTLPDGRVGNAVHGMQLFESPAVGCATRMCHPRPTFSADQDPQTRNHFEDVGTPVILPLHPEWQEQAWKGWPPPPLTGTWDVFPLLESGAGGLAVQDGAVIPAQTFAQRAVLELKGGRPHGHTESLSAEDKDDLLAYLLSL